MIDDFSNHSGSESNFGSNLNNSFFYLIYFEIRYLTAIIFDVTRIQYRQIIQILVQSD